MFYIQVVLNQDVTFHIKSIKTVQYKTTFLFPYIVSNIYCMWWINTKSFVFFQYMVEWIFLATIITCVQ